MMVMDIRSISHLIRVQDSHYISFRFQVADLGIHPPPVHTLWDMRIYAYISPQPESSTMRGGDEAVDLCTITSTELGVRILLIRRCEVECFRGSGFENPKLLRSLARKPQPENYPTQNQKDANWTTPGNYYSHGKMTEKIGIGLERERDSRVNKKAIKKAKGSICIQYHSFFEDNKSAKQNNSRKRRER